MAKKRNEDLKNPVTAKLVEALAALDDMRAEEGSTDLERIKKYREVHHKITAMIIYINARIGD